MPQGWAFVCLIVAPLLLLAPLTDRDREKGGYALFLPGVLAMFLGTTGFAIVLGITRVVGEFVSMGPGPPDVVGTAFELLIRAPLEETARALAVLLPLRSRRLRRPYDAMRLGVGASLGFTLPDAFLRAADRPSDSWLVVALIAHVSVHVALSALWSFAIGRERRRRLGGRSFARAFVLAVVFGGLASHLMFERGRLALSAALPLVVSAIIAALIARRDLLRLSEAVPKKRLSRLLRVRTPSIEELEEALLRKPDRPLLVRWIAFGSLVTTGVLVTCLAGSIVMGQRSGVDFSTIDSGTDFDKALPPLILLGVATLLAFPISGFLVAKASAARSVLEPALASSTAIVLILVLLGLAAPVAIVFGLAIAPPAFALACAGAFVGLDR